MRPFFHSAQPLFNASDAGVFTGPDSNEDKVIRTGDTLFGSTVTVAQLWGDRSLNNRGQIAFVYHLQDGTRGVAVATPVPSLHLAPVAGALDVSWPDTVTGYLLQTTTNLVPPVNWQTITNGIMDNGTWKIYAVTTTADAIRFFRISQ